MTTHKQSRRKTLSATGLAVAAGLTVVPGSRR